MDRPTDGQIGAKQYTTSSSKGRGGGHQKGLDAYERSIDLDHDQSVQSKQVELGQNFSQMFSIYSVCPKTRVRIHQPFSRTFFVFFSKICKFEYKTTDDWLNRMV